MCARHSPKRIHLIADAEAVVGDLVGVFGGTEVEEVVLSPQKLESSVLR